MKKKIKHKTQIALFLVLFVFFISLNGINTYNNLGDKICECDDCSDCTNALNDNNCILVKLTANVINQSEDCVYDPQNFNNKTFDCQGHTIKGAGTGYGIYLYGKSNNTIKNCVIINFDDGIYLSSSSNNTLTNNIANNSRDGISLDSSSNNTLTNNTANNSWVGIYLQYSSNDNLTNNTANNNKYGIDLQSSSNNTLTGNTASNNNYGLFLSPFTYVAIVTSASENTSSFLSSYNILISNTLCNNSEYDIYNKGSGSMGDNNIGDKALNWNDTGTIGFTYSCSFALLRQHSCCLFGFGCGLSFIFCWYWWFVLLLALVASYVAYNKYNKNC